MFTFGIGQKSCDVVVELSQLSSQRGHLNFLLSDFSTSQRNRRKEATVCELEADHRQNRAKIGRLSEPDYVSKNVGNLLEGFRKSLESQDFPTHITIVSDFANNGNLGSLLQRELKDEFPYVPMLSVLIQPIEGLQGASALKCLIELQTSLEVCDGVIIRGYDDARALLEMEHCEVSYSNLNNVIAADLATLSLQSNISSIDLPSGVTTWPWGVCRTRAKFFDIRSSLWRASNLHLKSSLLASKSSAPKYNAIRAAANNIHALHQSYTSVDDDGVDNMSHYRGSIIRSASVVDLSFDQRLGGLTASPTQCSSSELATLMKWAAPGVIWPDDIGAGSSALSSKSSIDRISRPLMRAGAAGAATVSSMNNVASSSSSTLRSSSRESSQLLSTRDSIGRAKLSTKNGSMAAENKHIPRPSDLPVVTAIAFESPYARDYLQRILVKAKALLEVNAYAHMFVNDGGGASYEDLFCCCESIQSYLEN